MVCEVAGRAMQLLLILLLSFSVVYTVRFLKLVFILIMLQQKVLKTIKDTLSCFPQIDFLVNVMLSHAKSCMTNSPLAKWTWTLRRQQHKVVCVNLSAPQSLAFDLKGCCSQHRMKACIVPLYTDAIFVPSAPNYHVKDSWHWEKHLSFVSLSHLQMT